MYYLSYYITAAKLGEVQPNKILVWECLKVIVATQFNQEALLRLRIRWCQKYF